MYSRKRKLHERERNHKSTDLRSIALDVTNKCNMSCRFCYAETFAYKDVISLEDLAPALEEAYEMGVCHYILQGGEVCADYERLKDILLMLHPEETYINIVSNGWMMTRDKILELRELQVDKITFSLDSGIEEEHDANRMKGSYRRVLEAIAHVKDAGLLTGISTVVTNKSLYSEGFRKAYDIAREQEIRFDVQIAEPVGKWDANKECLMREQDSEHIWNMYKTSPILPNGQTMVKRDLYFGEDRMCPGGRRFMAITATGEFMPCNFIQTTLGNVRNKSLRKMREDLLQSPWFRDNHPYCILGECSKFFDEIVEKYKDVPKPLDAYEVFSIAPVE